MENMKRGLVWVNIITEGKCVIGARNLSEVLNWIDASYSVDNRMSIYMVEAIAMVYGIIHGYSPKNINIKSSIEAELVGMSEYIPYNLWLVMLLNEQGYEIKDNVVFQDNKSAILMENNGIKSCTGNSRHINFRFFS